MNYLNSVPLRWSVVVIVRPISHRVGKFGEHSV